MKEIDAVRGGHKIERDNRKDKRAMLHFLQIAARESKKYFIIV